MSDYGELKRLAKAATPGPWYARDYGSYDGKGSHWFIDTEHPHDIVDDQDGGFSPNHWDDARGERDMKFIAAANPSAVLALVNENTSLKGSCKALGGRHLRYLERYIRVVERKNAKHVTNRNEFVSCMERKGEEIDNLKADNKALLEALEDMVITYEYEASSENPSLLAAKAAIENARKTAAK